MRTKVVLLRLSVDDVRLAFRNTWSVRSKRCGPLRYGPIWPIDCRPIDSTRSVL